MLDFEIVAPHNSQQPSHFCVILHGLGDSMNGWKPMAGEFAVDGLAYIFINAPDAYGPGFSWFPYPGINGPQDDYAGLQKAIARSRELLLETITHCQKELSISSDKIILLGFSQGCVMVMDTALRSNVPYAGVLGISGGLPLITDYPDAFGEAIHEHPYLMTHGIYDDVLDMSVTKSGVTALQAMDVEVDWREYHKAHSLDPVKEIPEMRAWLQKVMGVGSGSGQTSV